MLLCAKANWESGCFPADNCLSVFIYMGEVSPPTPIPEKKAF